MPQTTGKDVLLAAFNEKEWNRVPSEIAKKLETYIGEKFDELITARALLETKSYNAAHSLSEIQTKYDTIFKEHEEQARKLDGANRTIEELEGVLSTSVADVNKLQATCNKLEQESADMRNSRNLLSDERDQLNRMIDRRNAEVERMQADINTITKQLAEAVNAKCEAMANTNEVESMKLSIEYREKRMEQERALLNKQIKQLTDDLDSRTEELLNMRRDNTSRCVQLDIKLSEKIQELAAANDSIKILTESNKTLMDKTEEFMQKLAAEKETYGNTLEAFEHEVDAQKKIAELYKSVSDEKTKHADELAEAVQDLKEKLDNALEKYGDLETEHKEAQLAHEEILAKKTECVAMLKKELETVNDLLNNSKQDVQREVEDISPKAAAASRLIKSGMTMTEIYTQYVQVSENLAHEKVENSRLQSYIQSIIQELEDKGPLIAKQRENYERALETVNEMTKQTENLINENQQLRDANSDLKRAEVSIARENARFKKEVTDLSRQVCHLLREVEHSRAGSSSTSTDHDMGDSTCSADIISKRLVTFSDISELQSTNQRLLALVRELSSKQEEAEMVGPEVVASLQVKLESMRESHADLLEQQEKQNGMMKMLIEQRDTYKALYQQFMKGNVENLTLDGDKSSPSPKNHDESDMHTDDKYQDLERALEKAKKEVQLVKEEFDTYKSEKNQNEKLLVEQMDKTRSELQEIVRQNSKLSTKCETVDEMLKVQKGNVIVYKGQIDRLEERNRIYGESIAKHETAQSYLKDQILESQTKLSKAEVMLSNLQKENSMLRDAELRLTRERDSLQREHQAHSIMQTNIELIKATLERNDAESKIRLEEAVKEAHRECAAMRRRLQEEQDRFRELGEHLEKKTQQAVSRMQEEKSHADQLRKDLAEARDDLGVKAVKVEELSKKLKNSLLSDIEISAEGKRYRELEQLLNDTQAEVESMKQKLKIAKDAVEQHCNVAQAAEQQLIDLNEQNKIQKEVLEKKITEQEAKITDLEEKCSELQGELSLQSDGQVNVTSSLHVKLNKLEIQHKVASTDLTESKTQLEEARAEITRLSENLEVAENKYTREMSLHSTDLQTLKIVKDDLTKLQSELNEIKHERDRAREALEESKSSWAVQEEQHNKDKIELEGRLKDLDKQNSLLLDQLQELNTQMSVVQTQISEPHNKSMGDSSFNKSFAEDDVKSSEQLLKIIKYLRQEKDICVSKCEILEAEHVRVKAQHEVLQKQLEEAKFAIESERQKSEVSIVTAAKHAEVLRQVETLNAITDSNRSLRIERDGLLTELNELKKRTTTLEDTLAPLQEKNKELQKKAEAMHTENITLRGEATRWRQRANMLIEKSNRSNPEDWKKLQGERETLAKQLTIERSNTSKLTEEINIATAEKVRLQDQIKQLKQQNDQHEEDITKLNEELGNLRGQVAGLSQDLDQTRNSLIRMTEDNRVLNDTVVNKEAILTDVKNNLAQIRKIAKKYKTQAEEQQKELDALKKQVEASEAEKNVSDEKKEELIQVARSQLEERIQNIEQTHNDRMTELNQQVSTTVEENEKNKREIETLKENLQNSLEKEERFKILFKNAKDRIVNLTEQNNSLKAQVNKDESAKSSDSTQQSTSNADVERLQKEKEEIMAEKQQEKERYLQEIEALNQRVTQLQRQLGLQQGSKPSTSSEKEKSTTEPPTANIKPMAGHSTNTQTQSVPIQPWRSGGEPPLASIRPMSMQLRTVAVLPTSQSPSTVMVPPQQQVHTTGSSGIEAMSSSPTSSHTDYVPATSSASSAMLGPRQLAVPPTQSNQDTEDEDNNMQVQQAPQQQAVALVLPRVEPPSPAQEQGTSSSSSNTVTTTQAGHKRPREADTESQHEEQGKNQQQPKRTRTLQGTSSGAEGSVSESGLEVEYQVPTSSQRDHEEDAVIVVESDEEGPDEGEGEDYNMPYEDPDTQDPDQDDEGGNEVEVIEDSSEVPNQSERGAESDMMPVDGEEEEECEAAEEGEEEEEAMQPEATSSGTNVSTSVAVTLPSFSRTRPVAPLSRQQQTHLLLPHGIEESGDDARRCDGFGEAVSSPHVPTSGRFTFSESGAPSNVASNDVLPEQTLEVTNDDSTGRSVPSTPLQTSPHESGPSSEEQPVHQGEGDIPSITVSGAEDEAEVAEAGESMGPPSVAGTSTEVTPPPEQAEEVQEGDDGVSSEGEKAASTEEGEEEGREAEASPSTNTRSRHVRGTTASIARRSMRQSHVRGVSRSGPTPIIWGEQARQQRQDMGHRGNRMPGQNYSPRTARRSRGRGQRNPYARF